MSIRQVVVETALILVPVIEILLIEAIAGGVEQAAAGRVADVVIVDLVRAWCLIDDQALDLRIECQANELQDIDRLNSVVGRANILEDAIQKVAIDRDRVVLGGRRRLAEAFI